MAISRKEEKWKEKDRKRVARKTNLELRQKVVEERETEYRNGEAENGKLNVGSVIFG